MAEIYFIPGQSGQNCAGDDEPGHGIFDNKTLSSKNTNMIRRKTLRNNCSSCHGLYY